MTTQTNPDPGAVTIGPATIDASLLRAAAKAVAPTAALTAWLYYIGWVKTNRQASYFGIDPSMLDYSTTDYVLRSVTSLLGPVGALLIGMTVVTGVRRIVIRIAEKRQDLLRRFRPVGHACTITGSALVLFGSIFLNQIGGTGYATILAASSLLAGGLSLMLGRYVLTFTKPTRKSGEASSEALEILAVGAVMVVGLFAAGFFYAVQVGEFAARSLEEELQERPEIHLLSTQDLQLGGATACEPIRGNDSAFSCRYTDLRMLVEANDRLFLVPEAWGKQAANSYVHVVPISDGIRMDIRQS